MAAILFCAAYVFEIEIASQPPLSLSLSLFLSFGRSVAGLPKLRMFQAVSRCRYLFGKVMRGRRTRTTDGEAVRGKGRTKTPSKFLAPSTVRAGLEMSF